MRGERWNADWWQWAAARPGVSTCREQQVGGNTSTGSPQGACTASRECQIEDLKVPGSIPGLGTACNCRDEAGDAEIP